MKLVNNNIWLALALSEHDFHDTALTWYAQGYEDRRWQRGATPRRRPSGSHGMLPIVISGRNFTR
jgi:hypothetical protein